MRATGEVFGVSDRGEYQGSGLGLVDDKGRVAIPAALRATLAANSPRADGKDGGTVIIGVHPQSPCLLAYDPGYISALKAKAASLEAARTAADGDVDYSIMRRNANGEPLPFDGSGRFIMPPVLRFQADIGEHAFFWGVFDGFEIWNPKTLIDDADAPAMMKKAAQFYARERGIAL